jgi:hypothetical protein
MHALPRTKKNHFSSTQWCYLTMLKARWLTRREGREKHTLCADHVGLRCPVSAGNLSSIPPRTRSVRNSVK